MKHVGFLKELYVKYLRKEEKKETKRKYVLLPAVMLNLAL